ncbi:MAG: hypothetical protein CVU85_02820 [Firmicutes bacterium HGW-Firmicutes-10]|nr:MAG: hypothetical protein CVU85_02820 [Firmicutes bacterium HGW-Firmicutes-10]
MKKLTLLILIVVVVLAGLGFYAWSNWERADQAAKRGIESIVKKDYAVAVNYFTEADYLQVMAIFTVGDRGIEEAFARNLSVEIIDYKRQNGYYIVNCWITNRDVSEVFDRVKQQHELSTDTVEDILKDPLLAQAFASAMYNPDIPLITRAVSVRVNLVGIQWVIVPSSEWMDAAMGGWLYLP